jgi:CRP-like cAMP-binding protein|nr:cyclic nucleotide-binding domain-containing protein [Kofleriaceae bacterium]
MAKDARALREEASAATAAGKHKRALAAYLELERVESRDAQWAKRAAEALRKLGRDDEAIAAYARSADRYAQNGFLVQAIAICKLVLQIRPGHPETLRRLTTMTEDLGAGPTRAASMAEHNVSLHEDPNVQALRRPGASAWRLGAQSEQSTGVIPVPIPHQHQQRQRPQSSVPPMSVPRTKSKPIVVDPTAALDQIHLANAVPSSRALTSQPGVYVIPIDDEDDADIDVSTDFDDASLDAIHIEQHDVRYSSPAIDIQSPDTLDLEAHQVDEPTELELDDIEEIPLAAPKAFSEAAKRALGQTPLFAGLPHETLEALVDHLELMSLERGDVLFREGEPSDALFVVVEGELSVQNEGPPRVEMARLGPSSFLGETALLTDQPRSATVVVAQPSEVLKIDRGTLARVLANHGAVLPAILRFVRDRLVDRWTRTSPLFRPFDDAARVELAAKFRFLEIEPDTKVLGAGTKPDGLYIVLAGQFAVIRGGATVAQLGPGDLIGETALLSGGAFRSDVISRGKSLALCLPAADFREVIMTHPHVLEYVGEQAEQARRLQIL